VTLQGNTSCDKLLSWEPERVARLG